jgi:hypothetical protein
LPLLPIDLQAIFTHLDQVGKEQAAIRNGIVGAQAQQAEEIVKKTEVSDNSVNESKDLDEGTQKIKDEQKQKAEKRRQRKEAKTKAGGGGEEKMQEIIKDPDLGHHIDITG